MREHRRAGLMERVLWIALLGQEFRGALAGDRGRWLGGWCAHRLLRLSPLCPRRNTDRRARTVGPDAAGPGQPDAAGAAVCFAGMNPQLQECQIG